MHTFVAEAAVSVCMRRTDSERFTRCAEDEIEKDFLYLSAQVALMRFPKLTEERDDLVLHLKYYKMWRETFDSKVSEQEATEKTTTAFLKQLKKWLGH